MSFFELFVWSCWGLVAFCYLVAAVAWLAGAVAGDHCSPISDTTIMSSAGAVAVLLFALVAGAVVSAVLAAVCWCWLKLHE